VSFSFIANILAAIFGDMFKTALKTPKKTFSVKRNHGNIKITLNSTSAFDKYRSLNKLRD